MFCDHRGFFNKLGIYPRFNLQLMMSTLSYSGLSHLDRSKKQYQFLSGIKNNNNNKFKKSYTMEHNVEKDCTSDYPQIIAYIINSRSSAGLIQL